MPARVNVGGNTGEDAGGAVKRRLLRRDVNVASRDMWRDTGSMAISLSEPPPGI
jgi:hypothetical protein